MNNLICFVYMIWYTVLFKRQSHKMVKHIQTIRRQFNNELFEYVWPFCGVGTNYKLYKNKHHEENNKTLKQHYIFHVFIYKWHLYINPWKLRFFSISCSIKKQHNLCLVYKISNAKNLWKNLILCFRIYYFNLSLTKKVATRRLRVVRMGRNNFY